RPKMLKQGTIVYELEYPKDVPEAERLKLVGGSGAVSGDYPPNIETLYNRYPETGEDFYTFEYKGSKQAIDRFRQLATSVSGIRIRPVIDVQGVQRIKLTAFELKTGADDTIERPKRIERPETSDALRRLANLEESKVSKEALRFSSSKKLLATKGGW